MSEPVRRLHVPNFSFIPYERTTISRDQVQRGFTFAPRYRSANKVCDHTTFQEWARTFVATHGIAAPFIFDNDGTDTNDRVGSGGRVVENLADGSALGRRRREIYAALDRANGPLDTIAYFGHGTERSLSSAGIALPHLPDSAQHIAAKASRYLVVILYACRAGTPGGFAEQLARELLRYGIHATIFGHEGSGHTGFNPRKRRYPGGEWVIAPGDPVRGEWVRRLQIRESQFFALYPFMEPRDLVGELEGRGPGPVGRFR